MDSVNVIGWEDEQVDIELIMSTYKKGVNADEIFARIYPQLKASSEKVYYKYGLRKMDHDDFISYMLETLYKCMNRYNKEHDASFKTFYLTALRNKIFYEMKQERRHRVASVSFDDVEMLVGDEDHNFANLVCEDNTLLDEQVFIDSFPTVEERKIVKYILDTGVAPSRRNREYYQLGMLQKDFILAMRNIKDRYRTREII